MNANYEFQHEILRQHLESISVSQLRDIIVNKDKETIRSIFFEALNKSALSMFASRYKFDCVFVDNGLNIPTLLLSFDNTIFGGPAAAECIAALVVVTSRVDYYTIESSFNAQMVLGQWKNGSHYNYGFFSKDDSTKMILTAIDRSKKAGQDNGGTKQAAPKTQPQTIKTSVSKPTIKTEKDKVVSTDPQLPYKKITKTSLRKLTAGVVFTLSVLIVFIVLFFSISAAVSNSKLGKYDDAKTIKLTSLDANQKVYCEVKDGKNYLYYKVDGNMVLYRFSNTSMYNTSNTVRSGCATSLQLKNYFGSNIYSGKPSISYTLPVAIPVGISITVFIIIVLIFLAIKLHKRAEEAIFRLTLKDPLFEKNQKAYDAKTISQTEFSRVRKTLLSREILHNNKLLDLFKFLY